MTPDSPGPPPPGGWLPPETSGESPAGGGAPGQPPPQQQPSPYAHPPGAWGAPPAQYGQPHGQQPPPGPPSAWASTYYWTPAEPDNTPGVTGFILSITSIGTLVLFFGVLSPINLCVSIAGAIVSRNGIKKVERGETTKNKDLAKWGFWLGIAGAVLAALVFAAFIAVVASDPDWLNDLDTSEPR